MAPLYPHVEEVLLSGQRLQHAGEAVILSVITARVHLGKITAGEAEIAAVQVAVPL